MQGVVASSASANTPLHSSVAPEGFRVEAPRNSTVGIFFFDRDFHLQIVVVVPDLDNAYFTSVVSAVEQCLGPEAYEVIVAGSHGEEEIEKSRLKAILAWRPAGLIVIPCSDAFPGRDFIESSETPYVIADRVTGNLRADTVSVDNEDAGAIGARHLIDLGHKDLLIAASSLSLANIRQRCSGATKAMRSRGLPEPPIVELVFSIDEASARLSKWFDENPPPTAIQALTNFTTLSVLTTLAERGLRMPRDMSLIGFDDYAWMRARATPLTAIFQPVRDMGRALWDTLSARITGDLSPAKHVLLPCEIRVRASTGPVHGSHPATHPTQEAFPRPAGMAVR
jgi:LacI family transcriptional regulator